MAIYIFRADYGKTTAFVGTTGSGKSTIVKLLLGLYDYQNGEIMINNSNLLDLNLEDLRQHIGVVTQETFLINDTIAANICYGSFDVSLDEIIRTAKLVEAEEFILTLPDGYNTLVGERGQKLSGGQRQRIALARAIIKNPAILVLDEATSALDNYTESLIQIAMEKVSKDRTTIVIAHRLSTVTNADIIHVLENGKIIESGCHNELLKKNGHYSKLWDIQKNN
jgi:ATP-binding cassette, subfamily B, bacterial